MDGDALLLEKVPQGRHVIQTAGVQAEARIQAFGRRLVGVKFRQKVVPGDTLILRLELLAPIRRGISTMKGYVFVGDKLVSEAEFMAQIVKNK